MRRLTATVTLALALLSCGPKGPVYHGAPPTVDGGWRTMRAEHLVSLVAHDDKGQPTKQTLRGVIAVARPDRFRLRALGPAGLTLFDILSIAGDVKVIAAIRDAGPGTKLGEITQAMGGDLAAAYDLEPRRAAPERTVEASATTVTIREPERTVVLGKFRDGGNGRAYPGHIDIDNRAKGYQVSVEVGSTTLDDAIDPAMFNSPAVGTR